MKTYGIQNYSYNNQYNCNNKKNNISFKGILLSNVQENDLRQVVRFLKGKGYYNLGIKRYYPINDVFKNMVELTREARMNGLHGYENEFGTVFFPWLKKAYIIGYRKEEKHILDQVRRVITKAEIQELV